jgi:putative CocE/NonD family hydrolase
LAKLCRLPPAETYDVVVEKNLKVIMPDGVTLLADRYFPRGGGKPPTILVRSPYGRGGLSGLQYGRLFAESGFQVLVQGCRGMADSGGQFEPFRHERVDGLATVQWIKGQDWFSGELATTGASYLAYAQRAIAHDAGPEIEATAVQVGQSDIVTHCYPGRSFTRDDVTCCRSDRVP